MVVGRAEYSFPIKTKMTERTQIINIKKCGQNFTPLLHINHHQPTQPPLTRCSSVLRASKVCHQHASAARSTQHHTTSTHMALLASSSRGLRLQPQVRPLQQHTPPTHSTRTHRSRPARKLTLPPCCVAARAVRHPHTTTNSPSPAAAAAAGARRWSRTPTSLT
jgi:hypothetical protein